MKTLKLGKILSYAILILVTVVSVLPFYLMAIMSTRESQEVVTSLHLLPGTNFVYNAIQVFQSGFLLYYWNSVYVAVTAATVGVLICAMAGYALAKYNFRGREFLTKLVLSTMMIPFGVCIIGFLIEMRTLKLSNSHLPLIICAMVSNYGVFLLTQFMKDGVPSEVLESARIDGLGEFGIFLKLVLPFSRAACVTLFLLIFMYSWNNFLIPLVFLNKQSLYTIPLGIFALGNQYRQEYGARMFALTLATIPVLIIFAANSKSLIRGLTAGAVKG